MGAVIKMAALVGQTLARAGRHHAPPALGAACVSKRNSSSQMAVRGQTSNTGAYKRGTGGRSSFSGLVTTVFGATGFVGRYVVNQLGKIGSQVIVPYRGDPYACRELRLAGDLGRILFLPYNLKDEETIRQAMQYSNVVVNLVGRNFKTKNFSLEDVHVEGARRIARIARESGVEKLIHFSNLNAAPELKRIVIKGGSKNLRMKFKGGEAVRAEFPDATIFRPADIYGDEDRFFQYYNSKWRRNLGHTPLWKLGNETVKMPVFVSDVARGVVQAIQNDETQGQIIECVGPRAYMLSEIVDYMNRCTRKFLSKRIPLTPDFLARAVAAEMTFPVKPRLILDILDQEHHSDSVRGDMTLKDLGVTLTNLEDRAKHECYPFRVCLSYEDAVGEFAEPAPPPYLNL